MKWRRSSERPARTITDPSLVCPIGYAYGAGGDTGSFHHVPLDQPLACAEAIKALLPGLNATAIADKI